MEFWLVVALESPTLKKMTENGKRKEKSYKTSQPET